MFSFLNEVLASRVDFIFCKCEYISLKIGLGTVIINNPSLAMVFITYIIEARNRNVLKPVIEYYTISDKE